MRKLPYKNHKIDESKLSKNEVTTLNVTCRAIVIKMYRKLILVNKSKNIHNRYVAILKRR